LWGSSAVVGRGSWGAVAVVLGGCAVSLQSLAVLVRLWLVTGACQGGAGCSTLLHILGAKLGIDEVRVQGQGEVQGEDLISGVLWHWCAPAQAPAR
jgi:hypothetical protein